MAVDISFLHLLLAYAFVLILLLFFKIRNIPEEKLLFIATFRMTIQLTLTGYLLTYIFRIDNLFLTVAIICIMEVFSILNIKNIVKRNIPKQMIKTISYSMVIGNISTLFFFLLIVVHPIPLFNPRYWIPLAGMIIGNAMTGMSIGVKTLLDGVKDNSSKIQTALNLGAEPQEALKEITNKSFESAILPTLNSMIGMGIVFLPGMMTGQILSGASPLSAIRYQIAIMLGITGSVALSIFIFTNFVWNNFFNEKKQFIIPK